MRPDVTTQLAPLRHPAARRARHRAATSWSAELKQRGIGTSVHYFPVHYHPYYRERFGFQPGDYPVGEAEFERLLSLPLFPLMTDADVDRVVGAVEEIVAAAPRLSASADEPAAARLRRRWSRCWGSSSSARCWRSSRC